MARPKPHNITPPMDDRQIEAINQNFDALFKDLITLGRDVDVTTRLPVGQGGTGRTGFSEFALLAGGLTPTGPLQQVNGLGTLGQVLTSQGPGLLPTWQDPTGGGAAAGYWIPITNGDPMSPELLFDSNGECIMGFVPA